MSSRNSTPIFVKAVPSNGGGCLTRHLLPPLAVVCASALGMIFMLGSTNPAKSAENPDQAFVNQTRAGQQVVSPVFTLEVQYWAGRIQKWAAAVGLDPNLVATVMQIESCGDPRALSRSGAMGLFQVMPYHFTSYDDPYNPDTNALRGLDYLRRSLESAHADPRLALVGYNGGIGVIGRPEGEWKAQTQRYAYWGSGIYADASSGADGSHRLQEWLAANGAALCRQAYMRLGINP